MRVRVGDDYTAAGVYALRHHIERLNLDHQQARRVGTHLAGLPYVQSVLPVQTNIVIFEVSGDPASSDADPRFRQVSHRAIRG